jgi:hypothetical protein
MKDSYRREWNRTERIPNGTNTLSFYLKGGEFDYLFLLRGRSRKED